MSHTQRIAETNHHHRHLTLRLAKEAIATYLELLAEKIAEGDWVDIYGIGEIRVTIDEGSGFTGLGQYPHLRTQLHLYQSQKEWCYSQ
ncbi:MAG: hypothetical protein HY862_13825 [Chloroflexi bacterium]|nr:hypothetical protein [Chloroflexota bacterium]